MSGLEAEFPGRVVAHNVNAREPESEAAIRELGFAHHGLVIRGADGQALWKQPDHEVDIDDVRSQLKELTARR